MRFFGVQPPVDLDVAVVVALTGTGGAGGCHGAPCCHSRNGSAYPPSCWPSGWRLRRHQTRSPRSPGVGGLSLWARLGEVVAGTDIARSAPLSAVLSWVGLGAPRGGLDANESNICLAESCVQAGGVVPAPTLSVMVDRTPVSAGIRTESCRQAGGIGVGLVQRARCGYPRPIRGSTYRAARHRNRERRRGEPGRALGSVAGGLVGGLAS